MDISDEGNKFTFQEFNKQNFMKKESLNFKELMKLQRFLFVSISIS